MPNITDLARTVLSRVFAIVALVALVSIPVSGQTPSCIVSSTLPPILHAEGLAELTGNIILTCTGGTIGSVAAPTPFLTFSTNLTNRLSLAGTPTNISVNVDTGGGPVSTGFSPQLFGSSVLVLNGITYTVPAGLTTITISGLFVSIGNTSLGTGETLVTAQVQASGVSIVGGSTQVFLGIESNSLLDSVNDNGIPCAGSSPPAIANFAFTDLITAGTSFSTIRVTEASATAFAPKAGAADTGVRIMVRLSGYGNSQVFVPDAIVGITGTVPTSAGDYATATISAGTYTPGMNQLLLVRVNGADASGTGGTLAFSAPASVMTFSSVSQLTLTNGSAFAVYEVVDGNPNLKEYAQIPVFVAAPASTCPSTAVPVLSATLAPVSTVALATQTDPIPRFLAVTPALDCTQIGDCAASYFPILVVNPTSVTLSGAASGVVQTASFAVGNGGGGLMPFTESITYQSGSGWLSASPASGANTTTITVSANPASLAQGAYQATVTVNAGVFGSLAVPVTFNVGPPGAVLAVSPTSVTLTGSAAGAAQQASLAVSNTGVGQLSYTVSVTYTTGSGWLSASPTSGTNAGTIGLTANPGSLAMGTYQAMVTLNGGAAGTVSVPVTFTVGAPAPQLAVSPSAITLAAASLGAAQQSSFGVSNTGGGQLGFTVSVTYQTGTNWLMVSPTVGTNATTVNLTANPATLTQGTYQATVTVNAGTAGTATVVVTFNVGAPATTIQGIVNSANLQTGPITANSYASIFGLSLAGTSVQVTFNSIPATIIYDGTTQINVLVPAALGTATQANVVASVSGQVSNTFTVSLTQNAPAVFTPGILNQDNSVNLMTQPATLGSYVQIFLTGLATPLAGPVTVTIGSVAGLIPTYAGVSSINGLEQVNVQVPSTLTFTGNASPLSICIAGSCSAPVNLYLH